MDPAQKRQKGFNTLKSWLCLTHLQFVEKIMTSKYIYRLGI